MYVRLAFAVAAHLEPEILLVDEVLAVGDAEFQKKCLGKVHGVATRQGCTVFFVSHNMTAVQSLCGNVIRLHDGRVQGIGDCDQQIGEYLRSFQTTRTAVLRPSTSLSLRKLDLWPAVVSSGAPLEFTIELESIRSTYLTALSLLLYSAYGARVAVIDLRKQGLRNMVLNGAPVTVNGQIHSLPLVEGEYRVGLFIATDSFHDDFLDLTSFRVVASHSNDNFVPYTATYRGVMELDFSATLRVADAQQDTLSEPKNNS